MKQLKLWMSLGTLLVVGCTTSPNHTNTTAADNAVKVKVQKLAIGSGSNESSYIGTIEESVSVPLSFLVSGTSERVLVEEGQHVNKGQLLAVVNSESYRNAYQVALAQQKVAEDAYNRLEPVYKKGSLPEVRFIEVQQRQDQARSMRAIAEKNLKDCNLYAPTSGVIGHKMIEAGQNVAPGIPVYRLVKIDKVKVKIPVPENEIAGLSKGLDFKVSVSALGKQEFEGKITEVGVLAHPLSHTYTIEVELNNPDEALKPGMVCNAVFNNQQLVNRLVVPMSAVQMGANGEKYVYVADAASNKAVKKEVETGGIVSNGIIIKSGLSDGDLLVVDGYQKVSNNTLIQIINQ